MGWYNRKHTRVVRSTFGAELMAEDDGFLSATLVQGLFSEIIAGPFTAAALATSLENGQLPVALDLATDNMGLHRALSVGDIKIPAETQLLYKAMKQRLRCRQISILWWLDTRDIISDALTKGSLSREPLLKRNFGAQVN